MFFPRYLWCELYSRKRQAVLIALGLALGVGLVVTVTAASSGVQNAQAGVLQGLYGIGTDITVTKPPPPFTPGSAGSGSSNMRIMMGPKGPEVCTGSGTSNCSSGAQTITALTGPQYSPQSAKTVTSIGKLNGVTAVDAGLLLVNRTTNVPAHLGTGGAAPSSDSFDVEGVNCASNDNLGPLSEGTLTSGRNLRPSDASANVAVVDSDYALSNKLKAGSSIAVNKTSFTIVGIVSQPQGAKPPDVYIPLARAQALATGNDGTSLKGDVNTIYVTAASSRDIPAVQHEISTMLPSATVTTPSSLANEVTGSLSSAGKLANDLGRWLSVLVLIAAFAVASLLTMAAVARRAREFGTLKALGWRNRRIIAQVMGESVVIGILGAAIGAGLGFAGTAIINGVAPKLSATVQTATGQHLMMAGANGSQSSSPTVSHTVAVPMAASVSATAIAAAIVLALVGALLAGSFGSWRIAQLRPVDALSRVG